MGTALNALFTLTLLVFAGCERNADAGRPTIDEAQAKQLVLSRYKQLFADKFLLNPADGKHHPFPPLTAVDVTRIAAEGPVWVVRVEPPSGVSLEARVDRKGQWTELVRVGYSAE